MTEEQPRVLMTHVIDAAERIYGLDRGAIACERKFGHLITPRRLVSLVGRVWLGRSLPEIGRRLYRDHTTVLHHIRAATIDLDDQLLFETRRLIDVAKGLAGAGRLSDDEWSDLVPWLMAGLPKPVSSGTIVRRADRAEESQGKADAEHYALQLRQWFRDNNARFITAMRRAHPEREIALQRVG